MAREPIRVAFVPWSVIEAVRHVLTIDVLLFLYGPTSQGIPFYVREVVWYSIVPASFIGASVWAIVGRPLWLRLLGAIALLASLVVKAAASFLILTGGRVH